MRENVCDVLRPVTWMVSWHVTGAVWWLELAMCTLFVREVRMCGAGGADAADKLKTTGELHARRASVVTISLRRGPNDPSRR